MILGIYGLSKKNIGDLSAKIYILGIYVVFFFYFLFFLIKCLFVSKKNKNKVYLKTTYLVIFFFWVERDVNKSYVK